MRLVFLVPLDQQEPQGQQDQQEPQELKVLQVDKVPLGLELQDLPEPLVQQEPQVREPQDPQDPQDQQVLLEQLALEVQLGQQDLLDPLVQQEHQEVLPEPLVQLDQVQLEPLDH